MTEISVDSIISRCQEIVASEIDGEIVMMSIENGAYYGIDVTGSRVWQLIGDPCKVSDLIARLVDEFEVDRSTCEHDVLLFLKELQKNKVIEVG